MPTPTPTPPPSDHVYSGPTVYQDGFRPRAVDVAAAADPTQLIAIIAACVVGAVLIAAVALLVFSGMQLRPTLRHTVSRAAAIVPIVGLVLAALSCGAVAVASGISPMPDHSAGDTARFEGWAKKTYGVKLSAASADALLSGRQAAVVQFGVRARITATPAEDGKLYLFSNAGNELARAAR